MNTKLWEKGQATDSRMQFLCVGNDPLIDGDLARADCVGSAAHAKMLAKVGLLTPSELAALLTALKTIHTEATNFGIEIPFELEDIHTTIESRLIKSCGDAGKKIHTARSRNDQVILAVRLRMREYLVSLMAQLSSLSDTISERYSLLSAIPLPGYTHYQPAMPSSFGLWLHGWYEALLDLQGAGLNLLQRIDCNPLGSGAGFGTSLPIDRSVVAELLGFARVQRSVIDVNNSRGRYELAALQWCEEIASLLEKLACEWILWLTREYGFISLPEKLCTGSSIMPQKQNPDIVELLRGRASKVRAAAMELSSLTAKLPSSYHRDFQYTKEPFFRGLKETTYMIEMAQIVMANFIVNCERTEACMYDDLYATFEANRQTMQGVSFRDAYRITADKVKRGEVQRKDYQQDFARAQADAERGFAEAQAEQAQLKQQIQEIADHYSRCEQRIFD